MSLQKLFTPYQLGDLQLSNRIVMAPLTRNRADSSGIPTDIMADYYSQRATAGLIVAEGTWPVVIGQAYSRQPGIETSEQISAWRKVTDAVHNKGGRIVVQIMHGGRIGCKAIKPDGVETVAPSAITAAGEVYTDSAGMQPYDQPRELTTEQVEEVVQQHKQAALNARAAGFDGVELHCTSGYLPMQFLSSGTNQRVDQYGGSLENRVRFPIECIKCMSDAIGSGRVGFRVRPASTYNDIHDDDPIATHMELFRQTSTMNLAYAHVMLSPDKSFDAYSRAREFFPDNLIINDGFDGHSAANAIDENLSDAVSFGRHFIANPDLVQRFQGDKPLADFNRKTLYTAGAVGYSDYPEAS